MGQMDGAVRSDVRGKKTHAFRYTFTTHSVEDIERSMSPAGLEPKGEEPGVLYCDTAGVCVFDTPERGYLEAMGAVLNAEAEEGRRLVQVIFRERQMIALWKIRHDHDEE